MSFESDLKKAFARQKVERSWWSNDKPKEPSKCHLCGKPCEKVGKVSVCVGGCIK